MPPAAPAPQTGALATRLLEQVRAAQRRALWLQGVALGLSATLFFAVGGALLAASFVTPGRALLLLAVPVGLAVLLFHGVHLARRTVGNFDRTARLVAGAIPELSFDLLAAVELSRALGQRADFSPEMARAFLRTVDERASRAHIAGVVDPRPTWRAWAGFAGVFAAMLLVLTFFTARVERGLTVALHRAERAATLRSPITGDVTLTYRYPAYTGLLPRTVEGTTGEVMAPLGTEVSLETRADRDVDSAAIDVNGTRTPLTLKGRRELAGSFVVDKPGVFHFVFLDGRTVEAEGPDLPIRVEPDLAPTVRLTSPVTELEVDSDKQTVTLKYDVSDDYGLSQLELVYTTPGQAEMRVPLSHDDGRTTHGEYAWQLDQLKLVPGQKVRYFIEAKDNDEVSGKKVGRSSTQVVKLYSAAEHRREALKKADALWQRLVAHLGDRMEGKDRLSDKTPEDAEAGESLDAQGNSLGLDLVTSSQELGREDDAPAELIAALANVGNQLQRDVGSTTVRRRLFLKMSAAGRGKDLSGPLTTAVTNEIRSTEKSVLYLEGLLDRVRMSDLKELAQQLRKDRRELSELLEQYKQTKEEDTKQALLNQMKQLRERMDELAERISELASGINDEFMNQEALREMEDQSNVRDGLSAIDQLIKEGKIDEAMTQLQEMAMQMDEMLKNLEDAADSADENADPELAKMFDDFSKNLDKLSKDQESLSDKTKQLRDKYREQMKEQIARRGEEVKDQVLRKADELRKDYETLDADDLGRNAEKPREAALQDLQHLESALKANDYDLALEAARELSQNAADLQNRGEQQRRLNEMFANPGDVRRRSKDTADRLAKDTRRADDIERSLEQLFPQSGQMMSEGDQQQLQGQEKQQKQLEQRAQELMQQMEGIQQRAPVFDPDSEQSLEQAGQRMQGATQKLGGKDPGKGYAEQQGALESLKGLQQSMQQQQQGKGGKGGFPMPMKRRSGNGKLANQEKVEIPDDDPSRAPRELRKDVMNAMKQGAPDRYKEQVKKYYEELVK